MELLLHGLSQSAKAFLLPSAPWFRSLHLAAKVVAIVDPSPKRDTMVGVLLPANSAAAALGPGALPQPPSAAAGGGAAAAAVAGGAGAVLALVPLDPRLPKGLVSAEAAAALPQKLR